MGDNGESCSLGLFRFSLGARLDTTSEWTKGGTTHSSSQGLRVFGLRVLERRRETESELNNPSWRLLSLWKWRPGNILQLGKIPAAVSTPVPRPSTYYLRTRLSVKQHCTPSERCSDRGGGEEEEDTHNQREDKNIASGDERSNAVPS